jgi:hypothetical protein
LIFSGDLVALEQILQQLEQLGESKSVKTEIKSLQELRQLENEAQAFYENGDYRRVVFLMNRCLQYSPASSR